MAKETQSPDIEPVQELETPVEAKAEKTPISQEGVPAGMKLVNEDALRDMMERMARLEAATDQNKLDRFDQAQANKSKVYHVKLATWEGKVVIAWENMSPEVNFSVRTPQGGRSEVVLCTLVLEDGTKTQVHYGDWVQKRGEITAEIKSRTQRGDDEELELLADNGKTYKTYTKFVNP